jgi:DnaJ-class molecular chaperone
VSLFPELTSAVPAAPQGRQRKPYDRVHCRSCQGWGVHNFNDERGLPYTTLECGTCGGTGRVRRDSLTAQEGA